MNAINKLNGNAKKFATRCYESVSINEMLTAQFSNEDADAWGISKSEWDDAITAAVSDRIDSNKINTLILFRIDDDKFIAEFSGTTGMGEPVERETANIDQKYTDEALEEALMIWGAFEHETMIKIVS